MDDQIDSSVLELNPEVWFIERNLNYKPEHFITAKTALTRQSALWIIHNLVGRYSFAGSSDISDDWEEVVFPSFEDSMEAVLYELKWG